MERREGGRGGKEGCQDEKIMKEEHLQLDRGSKGA